MMPDSILQDFADLPEAKPKSPYVERTQYHEYVMKNFDPLDVLDKNLIEELRQMVRAGSSVPNLMRYVQSRLGLAESRWELPAVYLRHSFCLSISTVKDIASWCFGDHGHSIEQINEETMRLLMSQRDKWDPEPEMEAEPPVA